MKKRCIAAAFTLLMSTLWGARESVWFINKTKDGVLVQEKYKSASSASDGTPEELVLGEVVVHSGRAESYKPKNENSDFVVSPWLCGYKVRIPAQDYKNRFEITGGPYFRVK